MKALVILGTRPNFIKQFSFGRACINHDVNVVTVHTGQHYDKTMFDVFFDELNMPSPNYVNDLDRTSPATELGDIMAFIEKILHQELPDVTLVYGDVTSTMAGALASAKLGIPVAHVECGVHTPHIYNPEELNRRVTETTAHTLFPHVKSAYDNLIASGFPSENVFLTGDIVKDSLLAVVDEQNIDLTNEGYVAVTIHRAENTDSRERLGIICQEMINCSRPIRFAVHPRTRKALGRFDLLNSLTSCDHIELLEPQSFINSVRLIAGADRVLSDSGGVRREAYILGKPVISLTDLIWVPEMVTANWEFVAGADPEKIRIGLNDFTPPPDRPEIFGDGNAAECMVKTLLDRYGDARKSAYHPVTGLANTDSLTSASLEQLARKTAPVERTDSLRTLISLVIPCYNEEDSLPTLFYRLASLRKTIDRTQYRLEYVLVDDGSADQTWSMLTSHFAGDTTVRLVRNKTNIGYGGALKKGLLAASGDIIVTVDADTNYDLREAPKLIETMDKDTDIVTASPFMSASKWNYPVHRFLFSRGVVMLYRFLLGSKAGNIVTFTSGFRAYRSRCIPNVIPDADDFLANAEILVRALMGGLKVEQASAVIYERKFGQSKLKTVRTILSHLGFMWRLWRGEITVRSPARQ